MGRSPCCSKVGLNRRGVWTPAEDEILTDYIQLHGEGRWRNLPKRAGLMRCGKSCRLRWLNYLRPDIKRGNISDDEEDLIIRLHKLLGNRWSLIAGRLPGRTDNEVKNYWNTTLRKKVRDNHTTSSSSTPKTTAKLNKLKKREKKKCQSAQDNIVDSNLGQTPAPKCTELINSLKPDDHITNVLEPNTPSTFHLKVKSHEDEMYTDLIRPKIIQDTVSASTNEDVTEPKHNNQLTLNLEPYIDSSDIDLTGLLSPDFSSLFGSVIHNHAENKINSTLPSYDQDKSIMEMLEELWSAENMIIEPNLASCTDLHLPSTPDCIEDWLL